MSLLSVALTTGLMQAPINPEQVAEVRALQAASEIFVVPCSQSKVSRAGEEDLPARGVYIGNAFRISAAALERRRLAWVVLSGGYGFLRPLTLIRSYEHRIADPALDLEWLACAVEVVKRCHPFLLTVPRLVVLGSRHYVAAARTILAAAGRSSELPAVEAPVVGLPLGRMCQALAGEKWAHPEQSLLEHACV